MVSENKQVILKNYVDGVPKESDMEVKVTDNIELIAPKGSGGIFVQNLPLSLGIEGFGIARVLSSDNPGFVPGDIVKGMTKWEEYSLIVRTEQLSKIQPDDQIPLSFHLGLLGMQCCSWPPNKFDIE